MNEMYQRTAGLRTGERLNTALVSVKPAKFTKETRSDQGVGKVRKIWNSEGGSTIGEESADGRR